MKRRHPNPLIYILPLVLVVAIIAIVLVMLLQPQAPEGGGAQVSLNDSVVYVVADQQGYDAFAAIANSSGMHLQHILPQDFDSYKTGVSLIVICVLDSSNPDCHGLLSASERDNVGESGGMSMLKRDIYAAPQLILIYAGGSYAEILAAMQAGAAPASEEELEKTQMVSPNSNDSRTIGTLSPFNGAGTGIFLATPIADAFGDVVDEENLEWFDEKFGELEDTLLPGVRNYQDCFEIFTAATPFPPKCDASCAFYLLLSVKQGDGMHEMGASEVPEDEVVAKQYVGFALPVQMSEEQAVQLYGLEDSSYKSYEAKPNGELKKTNNDAGEELKKDQFPFCDTFLPEVTWFFRAIHADGAIYSPISAEMLSLVLPRCIEPYPVEPDVPSTMFFNTLLKTTYEAYYLMRVNPFPFASNCLYPVQGYYPSGTALLIAPPPTLAGYDFGETYVLTKYDLIGETTKSVPLGIADLIDVNWIYQPQLDAVTMTRPYVLNLLYEPWYRLDIEPQEIWGRAGERGSWLPQDLRYHLNSLKKAWYKNGTQVHIIAPETSFVGAPFGGWYVDGAPAEGSPNAVIDPANPRGITVVMNQAHLLEVAFGQQYSLDITPQSVDIWPNGVANYTIYLHSVTGYEQPIELYLDDIPGGLAVDMPITSVQRLAPGETVEIPLTLTSTYKTHPVRRLATVRAQSVNDSKERMFWIDVETLIMGYTMYLDQPYDISPGYQKTIQIQTGTTKSAVLYLTMYVLGDDNVPHPTLRANISASGLPAGTGFWIPTGNSMMLESDKQYVLPFEITTSAAAPLGTYDVAINVVTEALDTAESNRSKHFYLQTYSAPQPQEDFSLSASPSQMSIQRGTWPAPYVIGLTSINGFGSAVNITGENLPANTNLVLLQNPVVVPQNGVVYFNVTLSPSYTTPPGTYTFNVKGECGGKTHTIQLTAVIS